MMLASGIGASILVGWGFDTYPPTIIKVWIVATFTAYGFYLGALFGSFERLAIFGILFAMISFVGS